MDIAGALFYAVSLQQLKETRSKGDIKKSVLMAVRVFEK